MTMNKPTMTISKKCAVCCKALRDCTGRECAKLGGKVGAWLGRIAAKVKPGDVVGDVLDEAEVRKMYGR
jgi:hypothetical protein